MRANRRAWLFAALAALLVGGTAFARFAVNPVVGQGLISTGANRQ